MLPISFLKRNIGDYSWGYSILKKYFKFVHHRLYYRDVIVKGQENIPSEGAVIFAPNHENHLMDPLAILFTRKGQPVFMARADIFKSKLLVKTLNFLKILPIFRQRDGVDTIKLNDEVFAIVIDHLLNERDLVILPEGSTLAVKKLRPLKKGLTRIAFSTKERGGEDFKLSIVPVGLDFTNFTKHSESLLVQYGEPIDIDDYLSSYKENPNKGLKEVTDELKQRMKSLMVDVDAYDEYPLVNTLLQSSISKNESHEAIYEKELSWVESVKQYKTENTEAYQELIETEKVFRNALSDFHWDVDQWFLAQQKVSFLDVIKSLVFLPVFVVGALLGMLPLYFSHLVGKSMKDQAFYSTMRFGTSLVFVSIFLLLYTGLILTFLPIYPAIASVVAMPFILMWVNQMKFSYKHIRKKVQWSWLMLFQKKKMMKLLRMQWQIQDHFE